MAILSVAGVIAVKYKEISSHIRNLELFNNGDMLRFDGTTKDIA